MKLGTGIKPTIQAGHVSIHKTIDAFNFDGENNAHLPLWYACCFIATCLGNMDLIAS